MICKIDRDDIQDIAKNQILFIESELKYNKEFHTVKLNDNDIPKLDRHTFIIGFTSKCVHFLNCCRSNDLNQPFYLFSRSSCFPLYELFLAESREIYDCLFDVPRDNEVWHSEGWSFGRIWRLPKLRFIAEIKQD